MSDNKLIEMARSACKAATNHGASDARAFVARSRDTQLEWRDGKIDRIQETTTLGLGLSLYVNGRYSAHSTSDMRPDAVSSFVKEAVAMTRYLSPDQHRKLPTPKRYKQSEKKDLEMFDAAVASVKPEDRLNTAKAMEESARAADKEKVIISVTATIGDQNEDRACVTTNGQEIFEQSTRFWHVVETSIKDEGDRKPVGSADRNSVVAKNLPPAADLGPEALKRALDQRGMKQAPTGVYDLVIENRIASRFFGALVRPLSGSALQQKQSCMEGKIGQKVGSRLLTVTSDPFIAKGLGSTAFDGEGMASIKLPLFENGVLCNYFLDTYYASKLGMTPTTGSASNIEWALGKRNCDEMIKSLKNGIFVTSFLGGNSNSATGDYSMGIKGFLVQKGKIVHPVSEMNISGNIFTTWAELAEVGNDPWMFSSNRSPSLLFKKVQCSGVK